MAANFCSNCGEELDTGIQYCPQCGTRIGSVSEPLTDVEDRQMANDPYPIQQSETMYKATVVAFGGFVAVFALGLVTGTLGLASLAGLQFLLGLLLVPVSVITMFVDLRELDDVLWDTRPILWVIAAILMYIIVMPMYVYKRRQRSRERRRAGV